MAEELEPDLESPPSHRPRHAAVHLPVLRPCLAAPELLKPARRGALAVVTAVGVGLLATASGIGRSVADTNGPATQAGAPAPATLADLSRNAPPGAKLLAANVVHVPNPAVATPAVITGLAANGIPNIALNGYRVAAARMTSADPSCGIDWTLLAGIGRIESDHGRYGGAALLSDGTSTPPIIGPVLDGTRWDYIADTDHGRYDGDPRFDHAVGPMQFIPSTWASYGVDANGNGQADPFDINDAALAAARYLCAAGGDLRTAGGRIRAVLAYNHSDSYLAIVLATAAAYAEGVPIGGPIFGVTIGPLPPVDTTWIPPANPADPPSASTFVPRNQHTARAGTAAPASQHRAAQPGVQPESSGAAQVDGGEVAASNGAGTNGSEAGPASSSSGGQPQPTQPGARPPIVAPTAAPASPVTNPTPGASTVVSGITCTITGLLGNLIPVPCPSSHQSGH